MTPKVFVDPVGWPDFAQREIFSEGRPLVASRGVFQNRLLVESLHARLRAALWVNRVVPNDGGLCLGQAALAATGARLGIS